MKPFPLFISQADQDIYILLSHSYHIFHRTLTRSEFHFYMKDSVSGILPEHYQVLCEVARFLLPCLPHLPHLSGSLRKAVRYKRAQNSETAVTALTKAEDSMLFFQDIQIYPAIPLHLLCISHKYRCLKYKARYSKRNFLLYAAVTQGFIKNS